MSTPRQANAIVDVDPKVVERVFNEYRGKAAANIEEARDKAQKPLEKAFDEAGPNLDITKIESIPGTAAEKCAKLVEIHSELAGYEQALSERSGFEQAAGRIRDGNRPGGDPARPSDLHAMQFARPRGLDDLVYDQLSADGGTGFAGAGGGGLIEVAVRMDGRGPDIMNALFATTAGWAPESTRRGGYVPSAQRPVQITDIVPAIATGQAAIKYMEETTFTNTAAEAAEGGAAAEAVLVLTERTEPVRKIAVHIPVTEEQLEDEDQVRGYLDSRLSFMLRQKLDNQIMTGNGTAPNLAGFTDRTGLTSLDWTITAAARSDTLKDVRRAKTKVRFTGRAVASHAVLEHTIWDEIAESTHDAGFYLGSPSDDFAERIWGLPVVQTDLLSSGVADADIGAVVGDFRNFSNLFIRRDFRLDVGTSADDFLKGQLRIRGTVRIGLAVYRPAAFVAISGPT